MDDNELDEERPPTPPHHPTAGVRMLRGEMERIIAFCFPGNDLVSVSQIASGKSFNNRIYFLKLQPTAAKTLSSRNILSHPVQFVLKLNGRFFGSNKIQNEVSCLQLVHRYCPDIPSPRVLAWSEDGRIATYAGAGQTRDYSADVSSGAEKIDHGGWILMTYVPGSPMPVAELDDETLIELGKQLGDIVTCLRRDIPSQRHCGNIRLPHKETGVQSIPVIDGTTLTIRDIIQEGIKVDEPIINVDDYYRLKLTDKLRQLETSDVYISSRSLAEPLQVFISEKLLELGLTDGNGSTSSQFVLTHYDLSPRNVLVSGKPPRITGLVDFEFAGFFPPTEEFLNDDGGKEWPQRFYEAYLARLHEKGIATPVQGFDPDVWNRNCSLEMLVQSVAPWYLPGGWDGEELEAKVKEAEATAREIINRLTA